MFDASLRRFVNGPIGSAGARLAAAGVSADLTSIAGLVFGLAAALSIAVGHFWIGLSLFLLNRLADGLDGAIATLTATSQNHEQLMHP